MSADNFYVVRRHPTGGYTAVEGFTSDIGPLRNTWSGDRSWPTVEAVLASGEFDDAEYGISVHKECNPDADER